MSGAVPARLSRRVGARLAYGGIAPGSRILVALSGGLDSMCLLHLLRFGVRGFELRAAHFDHAMRRDSAADAAWVRGVCRAWQVPLASARAERAPASENAARELRYHFLHDVFRTVGADVICTAHHADDQAETVLFRLIRGTGLTGLAGIPERRGVLFRPLLSRTRRELESYAAAAGLRWRDDPSNLDLRYARNRIRHVLLPALEATRPGAARRLARLAQRAAEAESAWQQVVEEAVGRVVLARSEHGFTLARDLLLDYHPHVRARVLRQLLHELGSRPDRSGTRSAMKFISSGRSGSRIDLAGGVQLDREFDRFQLRTPALGSAGPDVPLEIRGPDTGSGSFVAGGKVFAARWAIAPHPTGAGHTATFDLSRLRFPLELRAWRPGERVRLHYGRKKLKKLLRERHVGRTARSQVPVLADVAGEVLWVVGHARAQCALPRSQESVFTITVLDGEPL
jgi:tRNA(Ile)-lysidine synthase